MKRARISTTVDAERLDACRRLLGVSDSQLVDRALGALRDKLERDQELVALERDPYDDDPDLRWTAPPGPSLAYGGDIPDDVIEIIEARRRSRSQA